MTDFKSYILLIPFCVLLCVAVYPQQANDTALLRKTIEQYPDSLSLHRNYINVYLKEAVANSDSLHPPDYPKSMKRLGFQYDAWMKKYPSSYILPFAIGDALCNMQLPAAKKYLQATVTVNPQFAPAWADLYLDAQRRGDYEAGRIFIRKAADLAPDNPDYAFYAVVNLDQADTLKWRDDVYKFVHRFPDNERGAQALYWLAYRVENDTTKRETYEQLRKLYPPERFNWSRYGMDNYFSFLLNADSIRQALDLSQYMLNLSKTDNDKNNWANNKELANDIYSIDNMLQKGLADLAWNVTESINISGNENIDLLKARTSDAAGNTKDAYSLALNDFAETPDKKMLDRLMFYGKKIGKNENDINRDVLQVRTNNAIAAPDFTFSRYTEKKSLSLTELKGKIVLVSFWFPGCGPCRTEFPHIERALKKFNRDSIVYLAVNIEPSQDDYVTAFKLNTGYSFIPLHYDSVWPGNEKVHSAPLNLLLDKNGHIIFKNFPVSSFKDEASLEMMIREAAGANASEMQQL